MPPIKFARLCLCKLYDRLEDKDEKKLFYHFTNLALTSRVRYFRRTCLMLKPAHQTDRSSIIPMSSVHVYNIKVALSHLKDYSASFEKFAPRRHSYFCNNFL